MLRSPPTHPRSPPAEVPTWAATAKSLATRSGHRGLSGARRAPAAAFRAEPGTAAAGRHRAGGRGGWQEPGGGLSPGAAGEGAGGESGRAAVGGCGGTYLLRQRVPALGGAPSPEAR